MIQRWMTVGATRPPSFLLLLAFLALTIPAPSPAHADEPIRPDLWVTDGAVNATLLSGNTLYIGGGFTYVGPNTGSGVFLDSVSGSPLASYPKVNGEVQAVVPDGGGGWYIGGNFSQVGGVVRNNVAHILPNYALDPAWDPNADGRVYALAVSGGTVYAGGEFTTIDGQVRNYIAALDAATGSVNGWDPSADRAVRALAVSGGTVYVGGVFTSIGGQARNRIAALDAAGNAIAWNPNASGVFGGAGVLALAVSGGTVYVGGAFSNIGGQARNRIAALDAATGDATAWNPNAGSGGNHVSALAVSGGTVYAGGNFASIGGQARNNIAALDAVGNATTWDPNASGQVYALAVSGDTVYAGGYFHNIGGQGRNNIAALNAVGTATAWNPNAGGSVYALAVSEGTVYAGGRFGSIGGQTRNCIAALDLTTGSATAWDPNANGMVRVLAMSGGTVYAGGSFDNIGGQVRSGIAALDAATGSATTWDPDADGTVQALVVSGGAVYAGGTFSTIGGQARNRIAALDVTTGSATTWDPNASGQVYALAVSGDTVYAGGYFHNIGGQGRNNIAALDAMGTATGWNPNADDPVLALAVSGSTVYAAGEFENIGGQGRSYIATLEASTGSATAWDPNADSVVFALALSDGTIYAGGIFTSIGGQARNRIAALDAATGSATAWDPDAGNLNHGNEVYALAESGDTVYAGGYFHNMGGKSAHYLAGILKEVPGTVIIENETRPGGGSGFEFLQDIDNTGSFSLDDGGSKIFEGIAPGNYAVTEEDPATTPGRYDLTRMVCVDSDEEGTASSGDEGTRMATINLDAGETVTCTFTNTERGRIVVEKRTEPGGDPTSFFFDGDIKARLQDGEWERRTVEPGSYSVWETMPVGWALMDVNCSDGDSGGDTATATATYQVKAGETVVCTFTNAREGTLTVKQQTEPPESDSVFTFSGAVKAQLVDSQSATVKVTPGSHYVWQMVPAGWQLTSIECDDNDSVSDVGLGLATFKVKSGEDVTCTFTNIQDEPDFEIYLPLIVRNDA